MRFVVLLFGFLGCLLTALVGALYYQKEKIFPTLKDYGLSALEYLVDPAVVDPGLTGIFLLLCAGLGLLGTLLGFLRCGWQGSLLMFVPLVGPAILSPITLAGTSLQALTAVISMFVGPLPINNPGDDDDNDDDEDDD